MARTPVKSKRLPRNVVIHRRHLFATSIGAAVVFITAFIAFGPTVGNQFVAWDDDATIVENEQFRGLSPNHLAWMFATFHTGHWQPLSWVTFAINAKVADTLYGDPIDPRPYHFTNNLLHAVNALLLYLLALRLLARNQPSKHGSGTVATVIGAATAALLFALHPLRVESVAWATERRDVLSASFFLGTLLAYLRAVSSPPPSQSRLWKGIALMLMGLCILSKSIGVVLPAVMLVLDAYPLRRLVLSRRELLSRVNLQVVLEKWPFIVLSLAGSFAAIVAQRSAGAMFAAEQLGPEHRLYVMAHGFAMYVVKTLVPWNLCPLYEIPYNFSLGDRSFLLSAALLLAISAGAWALRKRWPAFTAVWCVYVILVLPVSGLLQSGPQVAADRYSYLSCMGFAILAGAALTIVLDRSTKSPVMRPVAILACLVASAITASLWILTVRQIRVWRDTFTLWNTVIAMRPQTSLAHMNRGVAYVRINDLPRAQIDLERAVELWPTDPTALRNLANVLSTRGDFANAEHYARRAVEADAEMAEARLELGFALLQLDRIDEAVEQFRAAFRLDPATWPRYRLLIEGLAARGRKPQAIQLAEEAVREHPELAEAQALLVQLTANPGNP